MTTKNAIKMRIFLRCVKLFSVSGVRKRPSVIFGLALILLIASASYYALKINLTSRPNYRAKNQPDANRQSIARGSYSDELFKSPGSNENEKPTHLYAEMGVPFIHTNSKKPYIPKERIVHLDLKGAPPTVAYLQRIFPMIKNLGATGVLLEYEDMFPYSGSLEDITAYNHYERKDVLEILSMADSTGLKVIPLVQTFGHLEFALKRPGFVHLRENPDSPQALCPSLNASLVFVENMISQIMELHRHRTPYLHIGCDEVYHLGECSRCAAAGRAPAQDDGGRARDALFLTHVVSVAKMIKRRWPEVRPLVWDDMMRHISDDLLSAFDIGAHVDPVVWWYTEDVYTFIQPPTWQKYSRVFRTAWAASAYKGAFGETMTAPRVRRHLANQLQWLRVMSEQSHHFPLDFAGIMLTGWQRYDHFAVLCELLPAAIPSLALSLLATSLGAVNATALRRFGSALGCPETRTDRDDSPLLFNLESDPYMWDALKNCIFPGSAFFKATSKLSVAETEALEFIDQITRHRGWLTEYSVRHRYSSAERADSAVGGADGAGSRLLRRLARLAGYARAALRGVADSHTADEWLEQKPYPLVLKLEQILADAAALKSIKTWERRPLRPPADLARLAETSDDLPV